MAKIKKTKPKLIIYDRAIKSMHSTAQYGEVQALELAPGVTVKET